MAKSRKTSPDTSAAAQCATPEKAQSWFRDNGIAIADWSVERGFNVSLVYAVVSGKRKCLRGESFRIAVALGLKQATPHATE